MDKNTTAFFNLIRKSQFDDIDLPDPSSVDWNYIYEEAKAQTVLGIIAPLVPEEIAQKDPLWREAIDRQTASYIQYLFAEEELVRLLDANQIPYVILKGNSAAVHYHHPERRQMGDIDFFVPPEVFQKTSALMIENGYLLDVESQSHPRHIRFNKNGAVFELHYRYSYDDEINIEKYLLVGIKTPSRVTILNHSFSTLPALSLGIVLLTHIQEHIKGALGLRQVIDWMMYVNQKLDDTFWFSTFQKAAHDIKLEMFAVTITKMCQIYLGLDNHISWCKDASEENCHKLMMILLSDGNFGKKERSGLAVGKVTSLFIKNGFFQTLQANGEGNWEAYKKHHWLKPFAWIYQLIRYIRKGLKTKRNIKQLLNDKQHEELRIKLLTDLEIL